MNKTDLKQYNRGESPGLVVIGGGSCSKGHEFESRHHILDGYFSHLFVVRIVMFFVKTKINEKEAKEGPFFENNLPFLCYGKNLFCSICREWHISKGGLITSVTRFGEISALWQIFNKSLSNSSGVF